MRPAASAECLQSQTCDAFMQGESQSRSHSYPSFEDVKQEDERVYTIGEGEYILEILGLEATDRGKDVDDYLKGIRGFAIQPRVVYGPPLPSHTPSSHALSLPQPVLQVNKPNHTNGVPSERGLVTYTSCSCTTIEPISGGFSEAQCCIGLSEEIQGRAIRERMTETSQTCLCCPSRGRVSMGQSSENQSHAGRGK